MDAELLHLIALARSGERTTALQGLREYLPAHPQEVNAWVLLAGLSTDQRVRLVALQRALALEPEHAAAQQALLALQTQSASPSAEVAPIPTILESTAQLPVRDTPAPFLSVVSDPVLPAEAAPVSPLATSDIPVLAVDAPAPLLSAMPEPAPLPGPEPEDNALAVRQARAFVWPFRPRGSEPMPLGTLLDEGRITRQDLLWAVEHAREPEVRQAAQDLLAHDHRLPDAGITLEAARLTAWPFRRLNQPLGMLVETGTVKEKDLRRAAWFATDARVREAARLLLPAAVAQRRAQTKRSKPKPAAVQEVLPASTTSAPAERGAQYVQGGARYQPSPARPMPIVEGADYLVQQIQRRRTQQLLLLGAIALLFAVILGVAGYIVVQQLLLQQSLSLWWIAALLLALAACLWIGDHLHDLAEEQRYFQLGQQGEIMAARVLRQGLNGLWILFRNVRLPGQHEDIDLVLLGPPGIFAVEVKAYSGYYAYRGQFWFQRVMMGWRRLRRNPGKQARANAGQLHAYIANTLGRDIWVEPRILWAGSGRLDLRQPEVYVWMLERLPEETERLRNLPGRVTEEEWAALTGLLKGLCSALQD